MLKAGGLLCPRPDCGMGIIPPPQNEDDEDDCRRIQCIGGCGVSERISFAENWNSDNIHDIENLILFPQYVFCRKCLQGFHVGDCESQPTSFSSASGTCPSGYAVDPLRASEVRYDQYQ